MAHQKVTTTGNLNVSGEANTYSYSGNFNVFQGDEVVVLLDGTKLTFKSTIDSHNTSPRQYSVDVTNKKVTIAGTGGVTPDISNASSLLSAENSITIRPETDLGDPTPRATYEPGSSVKSADLNNNQLQLMRKALEYDDQKLSSTGGTMDGDLQFAVGTKITFEGATANDHETTLTVTDPTADRTITLPNETGNVVVDTLPSTKIWVGNGSGAAAEVSLSGDVTMDNTGAVTIGSSAVEAGMIANDAVNTDKILDGTIVTGNINTNAAIDFTKLEDLDSGKILVGNASNKATEVAMSGDIAIDNAGATTIQADAVEIGMIGCEQSAGNLSNSESHIPTSAAVVSYVAAQLEPFGGFEVIDDRTKFPNTPPAAGVVISILDANGIVFDSTSTPDTTSGNCTEVDGTHVTIQAAPDALQGKTIGAGVGMLVSYVSGTNYKFHRLLAKDSDVEELSTDIEDFKARYRVGSSDPGSSNEAGDLFFNTSANKMKVYNADAGTWGEVTSTGDFKFITLVDTGTTNAAGYDGSKDTYDLIEGTSTGGSAASITTAYQLLVSLNGVIQKPNEGTFDTNGEGFYRIDANTIKFCDPPPSGSQVFVILIGSATELQIPANNSVTSAKIVDGTIVNADINSSADIAGSKLADDSIVEAKLDIHQAPSDGKFLKYTRSNGMEWGDVPAGVGGSNGVDFNDNVKARFGTGNDLEIYHNASNSIINDAGTGNLQLQVGGATVAEIDTDALKLTTYPFIEMGQTINFSPTISNNHNALTVGPVTITDGNTVTIGDGEHWVIV